MVLGAGSWFAVACRSPNPEPRTRNPEPRTQNQEPFSVEPSPSPVRLHSYRPMIAKSRYFLVGSAALLVVGIGGGLVAYYSYSREAGAAAGLPTELRYVP